MLPAYHPPEMLRRQEIMSFIPTDDQLNQARSHLREQELWIQQRDTQQRLRHEVDTAIEKLEVEISKARRSGKNFDSKQESLELLKKKRIELDRWLDQIEDVTENDLIASRHQLRQGFSCAIPGKPASGRNSKSGKKT